jgi:hypothetical protein
LDAFYMTGSPGTPYEDEMSEPLSTEEDLPAFIPWNSDRKSWSSKLETLWRQNCAPYKWQPPTGDGMNGAGWQRTTASRDKSREDWFGLIQQFLEERIADAPDETCRAVARNLWQETADFTDDD